MKVQQIQRWSIVPRFFILVILLGSAGAKAQDLYSGQRDAYWQKKTKVNRRIVEERYILATVKDRKKSLFSGERELKIKGAVLVGAPQEFTFEQLIKFEDFKNMSKYIKQLKYDALGNKLYVKAEAFSYSAQIMLKTLIKNHKKKEIQWEIVAGVMKGMKGVIELSPHKLRQTSMHLFAEYEYEKLPIPRFFVSFALEVVLKSIAGNLRSLVQDKYQQSLQ